MEHNSTIPSMLGPMTVPSGLHPGPLPAAETSIFMKLLLWSALGLLAFGALKYWMR